MNASSSIRVSSQEIQDSGLTERVAKVARSAAMVTPYTAFTRGGIRKFAVGSAEFKFFRIS
ncbi:MAG TPA: hypothetical protein VGM84_02480 [Steroidobacteraceae bacterium]|jgi:hypothetical protein